MTSRVILLTTYYAVSSCRLLLGADMSSDKQKQTDGLRFSGLQDYDTLSAGQHMT